jgi:hypothetical protein
MRRDAADAHRRAALCVAVSPIFSMMAQLDFDWSFDLGP